MGGSFISLACSRTFAKKMLKVRLVDSKSKDPKEQQLFHKVESIARKVRLPVCPEVGVYTAPELNVFATGPSKKRSLRAVSTTLYKYNRA